MDRKDYLSFISQQYFDVCWQLKDAGFPQLIQYGCRFFVGGTIYPGKERTLWAVAKSEPYGEVLLCSQFGGELYTYKSFVVSHCRFAPDLEFLMLKLPTATTLKKRKINYVSDEGFYSNIEYVCKCGKNEESGMTFEIAAAKLWLKLNPINVP